MGESRQTSSVPMGDNGEVAGIVQQARGRADGFTYGDDRAIGDRPNWQAQESEQLYSYATVNNEPGTAEEIGQSWAGHSASLSRASEDLYNAIAELGAAWVGQGAGAAQGSLVGIANSSAQASEAANTMSSRLTQQAAAAAELKKMPQPSDFDPGQMTAAMLAGGPAAMVKDMKPKFDAANDIKAQQVAYLEAYTTAMAEIDGSTPSFGPESLGLKPMSGVSTLSAGPVGGPGAYGMPGSGSPGGVLHGGLGATPIAAHGGEQNVAASGFQGGSHAAPPQAPPGAPAPGSAPAPGVGAGAGTGSVPSAPSVPTGGPNVAASLGGAAAGGALGYAGARSLAKGNRTGSTKQSSTDTTASNQQGASSAASVQQQQPGVVNPAGTIGGGAPQGAAPMGGMGGMGAGGARQEEEKEHTHASFLIDPDPDETFGATQATPPPVLGAWGSDDDEER
ncbi:hypothetical protein JHE00_12700 [Prauserella sp. ASG 168]|uniref:PPE domain-containing protein n=2 Tax=Prauserella cavernicola TaxID=2800127 RepID=A0A934V5I4_9PSEU|nr:hypothetical protein [Prauserella cavernicola]